MFDDNINNYKKALLIGTGGGNDIVSTLIPAQHLIKRGLEVDIAGILSPGAIHSFNGNLEQVVNKVEGDIKRFIPAPEDVPIPFIDSLLPTVIKNHNLEISSVYDFSIRYGTEKFVKEINNLVKENNYDLVLAVDVGGDILARGKEDNRLLSPVMDFTTLYLLKELEVDSLLLEFGLGTDGELRPDGMDEIIKGLNSDKLILNESSITKNDSEIIKFSEIFNEIKKIRSGHTAVMTLKTLNEGLKKDIITEYRFRSQIEKKKKMDDLL